MKRFEKFENQKRVTDEVQRLVAESDLTYIEAAIHYAHSNDLEEDYVAELLMKNDVILSKIEEEAEELHFLKKKARLPI